MPLFLITALFKVSSVVEFHLGKSFKLFSMFLLLPPTLQVGNLANDGVKLGTSSHTVRRCSADPHDGLEEESKGGTVRYISIIFHVSGPKLIQPDILS